MTPAVWSLRPFEPADAGAWVELQAEVTGRLGSAESLLAEEARRPATQVSRRWVMDRQDGAGRPQLVGGAHLYFFPFDPPDKLHVSIWVRPQARGQGVGRALWTEVAAAAQSQGGHGLVADIDDQDAESLSWAQRRGFGVHAHRFASELDLTTFDVAAHQAALGAAQAQGVSFHDLSGADEATLTRYLHFVADRLTETPDLAGHPRWPLAQVRQTLRLDETPRLDWLVLAVDQAGTWLGTTAMVRFRTQPTAYNELTAVHPQARGRGLALPLKLQAIARAQAEGLTLMRTNNHSTNAPMLRVNRRLEFQARPGRLEVHLRW